MSTDTPARQPKGVPVGGQFAATTHAEPELSLTGPKVTSKGRTTSVTLPDGTVQTRTSKTKQYSHVVVLSPEIPELVIKNREAAIERAKAAIAEREEALKDPKFKKRHRFPWDKDDPDVDHRGEPRYHSFEYFLMSADGKEQLETMWGNSKGDTKGCYDPETFEYDVKRIGRVITELKLHTLERVSRAHQDIAKYEADIEAVKNGTYNLGKYTVSDWASRPDLAEKASRQYAGWTRRATVQPIDQ